MRIDPLLAQRPARALYPVAGHVSETSPFDLARQAVGGMEIGGSEELRSADRIGIAVLTVRQVLDHDQPELRIIQPALIQPIKQRGEPADRHRQQAAAWPKHPPGLSKRLPPVCGIRQVIQRPEEQHRVLRLVSFR